MSQTTAIALTCLLLVALGLMVGVIWAWLEGLYHYGRGHDGRH